MFLARVISFRRATRLTKVLGSVARTRPIPNKAKFPVAVRLAFIGRSLCVAVPLKLLLHSQPSFGLLHVLSPVGR